MFFSPPTIVPGTIFSVSNTTNNFGQAGVPWALGQLLYVWLGTASSSVLAASFGAIDILPYLQSSTAAGVVGNLIVMTSTLLESLGLTAGNHTISLTTAAVVGGGFATAQYAGVRRVVSTFVLAQAATTDGTVTDTLALPSNSTLVQAGRFATSAAVNFQSSQTELAAAGVGAKLLLGEFSTQTPISSTGYKFGVTTPPSVVAAAHGHALLQGDTGSGGLLLAA